MNPMLNQAIDVFAKRWTVGFDVLRFWILLIRFYGVQFYDQCIHPKYDFYILYEGDSNVKIPKLYQIKLPSQLCRFFDKLYQSYLLDTTVRGM